MDATLVARLETPLPAALPVGRATAVLCAGTCFHRRERVVALDVRVDGVRHRSTARGMPRPDVYAADPAGFRSGFWATVPIPARERPGTVELALDARLASGARTLASLGRIDVVAPDPAPARPARPGLIAVCMATYEPDPALFAAQVASLRAQTHRDWVCVVSDDGSSAAAAERIAALLAGDARFRLSRSQRRRGPYRNFERALRLAPREAELIALCDQDDRWWPEKLEVLSRALGPAGLVYCDQRLVDAGGAVLGDTLWDARRNNHTDLVSLLVANSVTGAAALLRREVVELALPFPDTLGLPFHDHWLALVALACGDVAYVDRPLYDYVQHPGAVFGEVTHGRPAAARHGDGHPAGHPPGRLRGAYFHGYLAREVLARVLLARCAGRLTGAKRRALRRFVAAGRSPAALTWLAARSLRPAVRSATLGSERELVRGILWRWAVAALAIGARRPGRRPCDASVPAVLAFEQRRLRAWRARVSAPRTPGPRGR